MNRNQQQSPSNSNKKFFYRYASLGSQIIAGLGLAVFVGLKTDGWLNTLPLFSCLLPLLVLGAIFYKLFRETGNKTNDEGK